MAKTKYSVKLKTVLEEQELSPIHLSSGYDSVTINDDDINRPALQLAGFYNYFDPGRIQSIGRVESTYLDNLSHEDRLAAFDKLLSYPIPALIICHGCTAFEECITAAEKYDRSIFMTNENTSSVNMTLLTSLHRHLAPRKTVHGVLVEIYGEGVLLTGDSGIGKSETALELIKRGHRLIADDAVEIKKVSAGHLVGSAPELIRYYMELRGIGVINVRHIYGVGAVKPECDINMVVSMEPWIDGKMYDRLGVINETEDILGITLPKVTIPVRPGRNLAVILELAAMNNRQKKMGYNAAEMLEAAHDSAIDKGLL